MILDNKKLVVIMGAQRSGTTWLQAMLASHQAIVTKSELWLFSDYILKWFEAWNNHIKASRNSHTIGLPSIYTHDEFVKYTRQIVAGVYEKVSTLQPEATIILDKTPGYVHHVQSIITLVPNVHFINVIRDGRDVVASRLAAKHTWWKNQNHTTALHFAHEWVKSIRHGKQASEYSGQYTEVLYEDLLVNGIDTLKRIFDDLNLVVDDIWIEQVYQKHSIEKMRETYTVIETKESNDMSSGIFKADPNFYRKGQAMTWKTDLTSFQKFQVYRVANRTLIELGYVVPDQFWVSQSIWGQILNSSYIIYQNGKSFFNKK